jgi:DNA-binding NtrC family response regulator
MTLPKYPALPVLLVDDDAQSLLSESITLSSGGITHTIECQDSRRTLDLLATYGASVVVLDLTMPHLPGTQLLPSIARDHPEVPVVILTGMDETATAVECMKAGAFDYLVKPVDDNRLVTTVRRAIEHRDMQQENTLLKQHLLSDRLEHPEVFAAIVTRDTAMRSLFRYVEAVATTPLPKLVTGETGTGKELVARALHHLSGRAGEFLTVNVAGVDDTLFSDTLFGHKKGAFTGAESERKGLIEGAARGTLFLDEIGDLRPESQVKLLRLVQEGRYYSLGSDTPKLTDARLVVATNRSIELMQKSGTFRSDLYYRLRTHHIHIPPLRDRRDDIPLLLDHFLTKAALTLGRRRPTPPRELYSLLRAYHYPGNVRELEGLVFDAVSRHAGGVLSMDSFKAYILRASAGDHPLPRAPETPAESPMEFPDQLPTLEEMERMLIGEALRRCDGNQTMAAAMLGLTRRALNNRLIRSPKQPPAGTPPR